MIHIDFKNAPNCEQAAVNACATVWTIHPPDDEPRDPDARLFLSEWSFFRRIGVTIFVHRPPLLVRTMTMNRLYLN